MKKTSLSRDPVAIEAAEIMVNEMNRILEEDLGTRGKCAELKLKKNKVSADRFEEKSKMKLYKVSYVTQPGDGEFWGYVTQDPADGNNLKILSERFPRMNKYEHQARCAGTAKYAAYCYCKDLIQVPKGSKAAPNTTKSTTPKTERSSTLPKNIETERVPSSSLPSTESVEVVSSS